MGTSYAHDTELRATRLSKALGLVLIPMLKLVKGWRRGEDVLLRVLLWTLTKRKFHVPEAELIRRFSTGEPPERTYLA